MKMANALKRTLMVGVAVLSSFCITSSFASDKNLSQAQSQALSANPPTANKPSLPPTLIPPAPDINAKGYVLMDANSGRIIAEKNMHKKLQPASLTKLMTLYVASEALAQGQIKLTDKARVSESAWRRGGSRMFLKLGSHVPVKDLIDGIIVASGNDACVTMAQYIAGNEKSFAHLMNMTAKQLGMKDTHYVDSTGLPKPGHYSTPYDLALLTRALINNFPQYYGFYKQKWITWNGIRQPNRNRLLWRDPSVDGLKTGHTKEAGFCLISSAHRHNMRLISVVMGAPTDEGRSNESQSLLNWGFRFYDSYLLYKANTPITTQRIWLGKEKNVTFGLAKDLYVTIPAGQYPHLKAKMDIKPTLKAPIQKGQTYGDIVVTLNDKTVATAPLLALQSDPKGSVWSRMTDHIALMFKGWFS